MRKRDAAPAKAPKAAEAPLGPPPRHVFRWDLDKTYLQTDFDTLKALWRTAFEKPEETYSTSPHLYHDLGIDPAAQGTIAPSGPLRSKRPDQSSPSKPARLRPDRDPTRARTRRRLRNGVPVERKNVVTRSRDHGTATD